MIDLHWYHCPNQGANHMTPGVYQSPTGLIHTACVFLLQILLLWTEHLCSPKINVEAISPKMLVFGGPEECTKGETGHDSGVSMMELVAL